MSSSPSAAAYSARTSAGASTRHAPGRGIDRVTGPMRVRTRRRTGWPTSLHMRRTMRLRPSFTTISTSADARSFACLHEAARARAGSGRRRARRPLASRLSAPGVGHAVDFGEVLLLDAVARMRQQLRELAVVGEDQQPFGVAIEPADREHPRLVGYEVEHRAPALRIARGRHDVGGLVQQPVHERRVGDDRDAVDASRAPAPDRRAGRAPRARRRPRRGPPRSAPRSRGAIRTRRAPRPSASARPRPLRTRRATSSTPAWSSAARSAGSGSSGAAADGVSPGMRRPRSSASTTDASGTKSPSAGSWSSESRPSRSRNMVVVPNSTGLPERGFVADFFDVPAGDERLQRRVDVHAADRRELRA